MDYPKNVQIPYMVLMAAIEVLNSIDKNTLPENIRSKYDLVHRELYEKRSRIRNRFAYSDIIQAQSEDDREAARDNYLKTKELSIYL